MDMLRRRITWCGLPRLLCGIRPQVVIICRSMNFLLCYFAVFVCESRLTLTTDSASSIRLYALASGVERTLAPTSATEISCP